MDEGLAGEQVPASLELKGTVSPSQGVFSMCVSYDVSETRLAVRESERDRCRHLLSRGLKLDELSDLESRVRLGVGWADQDRPGDEPG